MFMALRKKAPQREKKGNDKETHTRASRENQYFTVSTNAHRTCSTVTIIARGDVLLCYRRLNVCHCLRLARTKCYIFAEI